MSKFILKGQCHAILGVRGEGRERGKNGKAGGGPPAPLFSSHLPFHFLPSFTPVGYFKSEKVSLYQLNSKNNGLVLLAKTILGH